MAFCPVCADGREQTHPGSRTNRAPGLNGVCRSVGRLGGARPAQTPRKRLMASTCLARSSGLRTPRPSAGARQSTPTLPWWALLVDVERGLADVVEAVGPRQGGVDHALGDEAVGLPGLAVVGEVGGDDPLEVHPQVAVVVLVHVAAGGRAGGDGAALAGHEHRGAERLAAGVLEDDVDVLAAGELTDLGAEALPLPAGPAWCSRRSRTCSPRRSG